MRSVQGHHVVMASFCTLKAAYMEPSEFTDLAATLGDMLAFFEVERVRRVLRDCCQDTSGQTSSWNDTKFTIKSCQYPQFGLATRHTLKHLEGARLSALSWHAFCLLKQFPR